MIYLVFSILFSSSIFIIFKGFEKYQINNYQAIIVNYLVAAGMGLMLYPSSLSINVLTQNNWFIPAAFIGVMFISLFLIMAVVSQKQGVSVASVAVKMSVVIPVIAGIILYNEAVHFYKIFGVILALFAVLLVTYKSESKNIKVLFLLPLVLFIGSGTLDALLKYSQEKLVPQDETALFSACLFLFAAIWGILAFPLLNKGRKLETKNIWAGLILGIPNFGSIYFLLKALEWSPLESSQLFPINNVGVVLLSTLLGLILFKEKLTRLNWVGVGIGALSILIVTQ